MPSIRVDEELNDGHYFVTLTIKHWYYILDRHNRWEIILKALKYCQENKSLKVFAFVFMVNHIHIIIQSEDVSGFLRDFKKYTSAKLMQNIRETEPKVAKLFEEDGGRYSVWQKTNMPKMIERYEYFAQKKEYIEGNPVRKNYVENPAHWIYSSAHEPCLLELSDIHEA